MKLLDTIKKLILENKKFPKLKYSEKVGDRNVQLVSTYHQWFDRFGDEDYEYIKDLTFQKPKNFRIGVSDKDIIPLFKKNLQKIEDSYNLHNSNRIIFVKHRLDNEDEERFDFIEFLLEKNGNSYDIISSKYSKDGRFLVMNFPVRTARVMIEDKNNKKYKFVYLD
jgi:hypothetical protein